MTVTAAEIEALRRDGEAARGQFEPPVLRTMTEVLASFINSARSLEADEDRVLHDVELLVRAIPLWQEEIREARTTLGALGYGTEITKLLSKLAARARRRPAILLPGRGVNHRQAHAEWSDDQPSQVDTTALRLAQ